MGIIVAVFTVDATRNKRKATAIAVVNRECLSVWSEYKGEPQRGNMAIPKEAKVR